VAPPAGSRSTPGVAAHRCRIVYDPQFIVVAVGTFAAELLVYREVVLGIWLLLFGAFAAWKTVRNLEGRPIEGRAAYTSARGRRVNNPVILSILALAFGGVGVYLVWLSA
jgi:hypothetical protein